MVTLAQELVYKTLYLVTRAGKLFIYILLQKDVSTQKEMSYNRKTSHAYQFQIFLYNFQKFESRILKGLQGYSFLLL